MLINKIRGVLNAYCMYVSYTFSADYSINQFWGKLDIKKERKIKFSTWLLANCELHVHIQLTKKNKSKK